MAAFSKDGDHTETTEVTKIMGYILRWTKTSQMLYRYTELHHLIPVRNLPVVPHWRT